MLVYYSTFIFEIVFNNLYSNEGASTMYSGFSIFVFNRLNLYSYPSWYVNSLIAFRESNTISAVGMRGGEQILSISKYDSNKGTALHEIGHALGLIHEQQRRDRDEYININWDNIQSDKKSNFKIWEESHAVIKYIPDVLFDYKSIMLYPSYNSFAIDYSKPTMTKKDGSTFNAQRNNLSYIDIVAIYDIYGFPTGGGGPSVTSIK